MLNPLIQFAMALKRHVLDEVKSGPDMPIYRAKTTHKVFDANEQLVGNTVFDLMEQESQGTRKYFYLAGLLIDVLDKGKVLIIDELEAQLHPFLTRSIIKLFNSSATNPRNAQLIFTTHDTSLLNKDFFRRDQLWFTEKDRYGASDLYSLAEFKVRNDASFDKDYVNGKYGAIPFIGGLRDIFGVHHDVS